VEDQREDAEEGVAQRDDPDRAGDGPERRDEEEELSHPSLAAAGYSPSARSGARSNGSASSISFVKIRSDRS
jgi:hypothetical protein